MDAITERKSSAAKFMEDHDAVVSELETAKITLDDQRKEIEKLDATIALQRDSIAQLSTDKNRYLQYSFELSSQLQFIVHGAARALLVAANVRNAIASSAKDIPAVPGADVAELESILARIGDTNSAAGDNHGLTNAAPQPPALPGASTQDLPPGVAPNGVMVDKDGQPIERSVASQSLQLAS